jgi:hypothetical protein
MGTSVADARMGGKMTAEAVRMGKRHTANWTAMFKNNVVAVETARNAIADHNGRRWKLVTGC